MRFPLLWWPQVLLSSITLQQIKASIVFLQYISSWHWVCVLKLHLVMQRGCRNLRATHTHTLVFSDKIQYQEGTTHPFGTVKESRLLETVFSNSSRSWRSTHFTNFNRQSWELPEQTTGTGLATEHRHMGFGHSSHVTHPCSVQWLQLCMNAGCACVLLLGPLSTCQGTASSDANRAGRAEPT